jgi:hypothetical protein
MCPQLRPTGLKNNNFTDAIHGTTFLNRYSSVIHLYIFFSFFFNATPPNSTFTPVFESCYTHNSFLQYVHSLLPLLPSTRTLQTGPRFDCVLAVILFPVTSTQLHSVSHRLHTYVRPVDDFGPSAAVSRQLADFAPPVQLQTIDSNTNLSYAELSLASDDCT